MSPDPAGINAVDPTNPQSWSRYAYALNSPLQYLDPSGLDYCAAGSALYDGDGNLIGYDSQCVSDEQYGDGSSYSGYTYVSTVETTEVSSSSSALNSDDMLQSLPGVQAPSASAYPTPQQILRVTAAAALSSGQAFVCKSSPTARILGSMKFGALKEGAKGVVAGAASGAFGEGVGAVPGAVIGGVVGSIMGRPAASLRAPEWRSPVAWLALMTDRARPEQGRPAPRRHRDALCPPGMKVPPALAAEAALARLGAGGRIAVHSGGSR